MPSAAGGVFLLGALTSGAAAQNVLFVAVDDLRPQLGVLGQSMTLTPNLDALAARGVAFKRAYCQVSVCSPSRTSFLTGKVHGVASAFSSSPASRLSFPLTA